MSEPEVRRCQVVDAPTGWPELHVLLVGHRRSTDPLAGREVARHRMRQLLLRHAGPEIAAPFLDSPRATRGACRASISHEQTHSVLAWCEQGCVGIDLVHPHRLADIAVPALAATAALYLGPAASATISATADASLAGRRFAEAWAHHEASLKCLGLALDEWSPALQQLMPRCSTAVVLPPSAVSAGAVSWVSRIAWRR